MSAASWLPCQHGGGVSVLPELWLPPGSPPPGCMLTGSRSIFSSAPGSGDVSLRLAPLPGPRSVTGAIVALCPFPPLECALRFPPGLSIMCSELSAFLFLLSATLLPTAHLWAETSPLLFVPPSPSAHGGLRLRVCCESGKLTGPVIRLRATRCPARPQQDTQQWTWPCTAPSSGSSAA